MAYLTIVTFRDEDGHEFPIAFHGRAENDAQAEQIARDRVEALRGDDFQPRGKLTLVTVENPPDIARDLHAKEGARR